MGILRLHYRERRAWHACFSERERGRESHPPCQNCRVTDVSRACLERKDAAPWPLGQAVHVPRLFPYRVLRTPYLVVQTASLESPAMARYNIILRFWNNLPAAIIPPVRAYPARRHEILTRYGQSAFFRFPCAEINRNNIHTCLFRENENGPTLSWPLGRMRCI